jgi:hypothetical protein
MRCQQEFCDCDENNGKKQRYKRDIQPTNQKGSWPNFPGGSGRAGRAARKQQMVCTNISTKRTVQKKHVDFVQSSHDCTEKDQERVSLFVCSIFVCLVVLPTVELINTKQMKATSSSSTQTSTEVQTKNKKSGKETHETAKAYTDRQYCLEMHQYIQAYRIELMPQAS